MDTCPHCGAPTPTGRSEDDRCIVCGMSLMSTVESSAEFDAVQTADFTHTPPPGPAPARTLNPASDLTPLPDDADDDDDDAPKGADLIRARKLSPEYEHRIAAAVQQTNHPFLNPQETLKSAKPNETDFSHLNVGARVVGSIHDEGAKDYALTEVIGEGAMGTVWSARQTSLDRDVAIKIPKGLARGEGGRRQFMSEVVVTGQLDHPNIVPIYELARDNTGQLFYAMKRVEGQPWIDLLNAKALTRQENLEILLKVCDAIRFAHDRGVIHRDIKPHNIMVGKYGEVSVMDWGIALRLDVDIRASRVTRISPAGTPAYMAPEMATGNAGEIGPPTDVYLLGAVLYQILTHEPPHPPPHDTGSDLEDCANALLIAARNEIQPIDEESELAEVAYRAMATQVEHRYQSVGEFQDAIREYLSHVESIKLTERGEQLLAKARANGYSNGDNRFDDFDRARFAFEEAIQIWPGNRPARGHRDETVLAYAQYAYENGDYNRGISLLSDEREDHKPLLGKLRAARRRTKNLSALLKTAVAAIFLIVSAAAFGLFGLWREADNQRGIAQTNAKEAQQQRDEAKRQEGEALRQKAEADRLRIEAEDQKEIAQMQRDEAETQKGIAQMQRTEAETQKGIAEMQRTEAETQRGIAERNERAAEAASYAFEIGLAAEELQRNAFDRAGEILQSQAASEAKKVLRSWEWGYLDGLVRTGTQSLDDAGKLVQGRIETTAASSDGSIIAAGSDVGDVYVWANNEYQKLTHLAYGSHVYAVAVAPNGQALFAAGRDRSGTHAVKVWSLPARDGDAPVRELAASDTAILSLDVSPNGQLLAVGRENGSATIVPVAGGTPRDIKTTSQENAVWGVEFSPDGEWLVTAGEDGSARVWPTAASVSGDQQVQESLRIDGSGQPVYAAAFAPNGQYIVMAGRDRRVVSVPFDAERARSQTYRPAAAVTARLETAGYVAPPSDLTLLGEHDAAIRAVSFARDGKTLFTAGDDHTVRVWNLSQGMDQVALEKVLRGHGGRVRSCVAIGDTDARVVSGGFDRRVRVWPWRQINYPLVLKSADERGLSDARLTACASSTAGDWIATGGQNGAVVVWNVKDLGNPQSQTLVEGHDWQATTAEYFDSGKRLLTAGGDNTALVWDSTRGNELVRIGGWQRTGAGSGWRGVAAVDPTGAIVATGAEGAALARLWDAQSGDLLAEVSAPQARTEQGEPSEATALAFAANGTRLLVGDQEGNCFVIDVSNRSLLRSFRGHESKINAARAIPGTSHVVTASSDGSARIWDTANGNSAPIATLAHGDRVLALDIDASGSLLVTAAGSADEQAVLRMWNLTSPNQPQIELPLSKFANASSGVAQEKLPVVRSVALHPTEKRALVSIYDPSQSLHPYSLYVWHWDTPQQLVERLTRSRDISMAVYAPHLSDDVLTVGGRGARLRPAAQFASTTTMMYRPQSNISSLAFSGDGKLLVSGGADGLLKVWRLDAQGKWQPDQSLVRGHAAAVVSIAFDPAQADHMLTADSEGNVKRWQAAGDEWKLDEAFTLAAGAGTRQVAFVPAIGGRAPGLATAGTAGVKLWSLDGAPLADQLTLPDGATFAANCLTLLPEQNLLVAGGAKDLVVWNLADGASAKIPAGHADELTSLALSPNGTRLFTGSRDYTVKVWSVAELAPRPAAQQADSAAARELLTLNGHTDEVTGICTSAAGYLVSISLDGQALIWTSSAPAEAPAANATVQR